MVSEHETPASDHLPDAASGSERVGEPIGGILNEADGTDGFTSGSQGVILPASLLPSHRTQINMRQRGRVIE